LLKRFRHQDRTTPVLFLTARDAVGQRVEGLDAGANDYVSKPVKFGVLLARIRAHLRQHQQSEDAVFSIGPYNFRPAHKMLVQKSNERKIRLTEKETAILKFLLRAGTEPVPRDVLLNDVWGYHADVTTHTLETHIYRLRQKIEEDPTNARLLVTEGGGYRLMP
jgi:DNA-binding response OmpR family regulator